MIWLHVIIGRRHQYGEYHRLMRELRLDSDRFQRQFTMSPTMFDELPSAIRPQLARTYTNWRQAIVIDLGQCCFESINKDLQ